MEGGGGDDGGAGGQGVVRETVFGIADRDLLLKEDTEPLGRLFVGIGEGEGARGNFAAIAWDGEGNGANVGGIGGTDQVDDGSAFAVDPFTVDGIESPGAVVDESTGRSDASFRDFDRVEGFDGVEANVGEFGNGFGHCEKDIKYWISDIGRRRRAVISNRLSVICKRGQADSERRLGVVGSQ